MFTSGDSALCRCSSVGLARSGAFDDQCEEQTVSAVHVRKGKKSKKSNFRITDIGMEGVMTLINLSTQLYGIV